MTAGLSESRLVDQMVASMAGPMVAWTATKRADHWAGEKVENSADLSGKKKVDPWAVGKVRPTVVRLGALKVERKVVMSEKLSAVQKAVEMAAQRAGSLGTK